MATIRARYSTNPLKNRSNAKRASSLLREPSNVAESLRTLSSFSKASLIELERRIGVKDDNVLSDSATFDGSRSREDALLALERFLSGLVEYLARLCPIEWQRFAPGTQLTRSRTVPMPRGRLPYFVSRRTSPSRSERCHRSPRHLSLNLSAESG